jgi:hypothetical protein
MDCIAAGLPTVASDGRAWALDAPPFVVRLLETAEPTAIAEGLAGLVGQARDEAAREAFVAEHSPERYVDRLFEALGLD